MAHQELKLEECAEKVKKGLSMIQHDKESITSLI